MSEDYGEQDAFRRPNVRPKKWRTPKVRRFAAIAESGQGLNRRTEPSETDVYAVRRISESIP
jgi:hypothetical protein